MNKLAAFATAAAFAVATAQTAIAGTTWRLSHWVPAANPVQTLGLEPWAKSIEAATEGRLKIEIYPAQQLGAAPDHYDMVRDGIAQIGWVAPGYEPGRFPIHELPELPFQATDAIQAAAAIKEWYMPIAEREMPEVFYCLSFPHDPGGLHTKMPVHVPGDLKGRNIRAGTATMARYIALVGGVSVRVPVPEAREAIARGLADGLTLPWASLQIFGIEKETPYHLDAPFYIAPQAVLINRAALDRLPEQDRKVVLDHCTPQWSSQITRGWAEVEMAGRERLRNDPAHTAYVPTEAELAEWKASTLPLLDEWKAAVTARGEDADAIYQSWLDALDRHGVLMK